MDGTLIIDINSPNDFLLDFCYSQKDQSINYIFLQKICNMRPKGQGTTTKKYLSSLKSLTQGRGSILESIADMQIGRGELTEREQQTLHSLGSQRLKTILLLTKMQKGRGMITPDEYKKFTVFSYSAQKDGIRHQIFEGLCIIQEGRGMMSNTDLSQIQSLCIYKGDINRYLLKLLVRELRGHGIPTRDNGVWYANTMIRFKNIKAGRGSYCDNQGKIINKKEIKEAQDIEELFGGNIVQKALSFIKTKLF